jgi:GrpB-like predicted nucleotidyltransferase (UPF0157 family)
VLWTFELVAYNPSWPKLYQNAVRSLQLHLPMMVAFEHVGSTALPGMTAVPTIDILAGVRELGEIEGPVIASLVAAGWEHRPDVEARIPNRRFFHQPSGTRHRTTRTGHLHIVKFDSPQWRDPITFRDFLRHHEETARHYLNLKRLLASRPYQNPSEYSAQKAEFVASVLVRATAC